MDQTGPTSTKTEPSHWSVRQVRAAAVRQLDELVMAWAKDAQSGEPKYIFELDASRHGAHCGCVCYSCGLPLTAVNAAKTEWQTRPHFRHPAGAERNACLVLTARAAALQMLRMENRVLLPARRMGVPVVGASGTQYTAWVTKPPEQVSIRYFKPEDHVSAILTLEDGRDLLVRLKGSLDANPEGAVMPVIELIVDDPELASLDPKKLKARLHLLVENSSWCGAHWDDAALTAQARQQAETQAADALDWLPPEAAEELGDDTSRESLLHWLAKEILLQQKRLQVPALAFREPWGGEPPRGYRELAQRPASQLQLSDVRLEKRVGQIRPDVIAEYVDPLDKRTGLLLVEVTVTNNISPERLDRIRQEGLAALEIDIGRLGGSLTRPEFARLLTDEVAAKKWLHHPWLVENEAARQVQLAEHARADALELADLRTRYLTAVEAYASLRALELSSPEGRQEREDALELVRSLGEELALWGVDKADDRELFGWQGCILDRLLSIRDNRVVGYRVESLWQVLNTVLCEKEPSKLAWHTLYLTALKVYAPALSPVHQNNVEKWRETVRSSLLDGQQVYRRSRRFDELLGFLFPEMKQYLKKALPSQPLVARAGSVPHGEAAEPRYPSKPANPFPSNTTRHSGRNDQGFWLTGAELEAWKRQNPEAAKAWGLNHPSE